MPRVIVFDVNETLLDLRGLDGEFERTFGDEAARKEWFGQMLSLAFVSVITERYTGFSAIGRAALGMMAQRRGIDLAEDEIARVAGGMRSLPPHPDVEPGLARLADAGLRVAALTNSTKEDADAQLTHAGIHHRFEAVLSVEFAGRLKPHPAVYHMAADRLGVPPEAIRLVAAHNWDVTGAMRAGCAAAFVERPGMTLGALDEHPDVIGPDLEVVADRIIQVEGPA